MKSRVRRRLVIAALLASAAPRAAFAVECTQTAAGVLQLSDMRTSRTAVALVVEGRVLDGACRPVAGAQVEVLWSSDAHDTAVATSGADGAFTVSVNVPPGADTAEFRVRVTHPDYALTA